ncbi:MAG: polysaccharide biosynthesis tyrosine autokinase [Timaviella obliquedivisa GSE-PSE-MK23-08B]|jgi:capsular exopolysaccharide synthesis family protein|nr:polysaccharide biosynthesis tyrosine autokinase [Timaviella obliquedivisa GSE-PSE-MK23-08B]
MEIKDYSSEEIDVQRYWLILRRRWLAAVGILSGVVAIATAYALMQRPVYRAEGKLLIKSSSASELTGLGETLGQLKALGEQNTPLDTQAEIIRSTPIVQGVIESLSLKDSDGKPLAADVLAKNLKVKGVTGTDVLQISYESEQPREASKVVNQLIDLFLKNNVQVNRAEAISARKFIEEQLPKTEDSVRQADSAVRKFKEENKLISLEEEAGQAVKLIGDLEGQITQTQALLADANERSQQLRSQLGLDSRQVVMFASLSQAPAVQEVFVQLQQAQSQLAIQQTRYRAGHPTVTALQRQVTALNALLTERVAQVSGNSQSVSPGNLQVGELQQGMISEYVQSESERLGLAQRVLLLSNAQAQYRQRASGLPKLEQTQRELARKLEAAQTTYETLLARQQAIQLAENQTIGNARILSAAVVPTRPIGASKAMIVAAGGVVGLLLAAATALILDLLDRSVKTVKEARELFGYTLLSIIPAFGRDGKISTYAGGLDQPVPRVIVKDAPCSAIGDAYHMLQANLKFLSSDDELKTIVVTSSVSKEGRSEVAANLAAAIAQVGRRVLLVDADMRHPAQHHIWDLMNLAGLSNVIVDQVALEAAVQQAMPNLRVLTSGVMPPNPIALLDSKRMNSLIATFSRDYDFVIFDSPAMAGTADSAVLGKMADGILLVVHPGVVDSASANSAKEFIAQSGQKVLGMVINGVNVRNEPDSYFYYAGDQVEENSEPSQRSGSFLGVPFRVANRRDRS